MKKIYVSILILQLFICKEAEAQYIPDSNFASAISSYCPTCIDSSHYLTADAQSLNELHIGIWNYIEDLTGLDGFTNLHVFTIGYSFVSIFPSVPSQLDTLAINGDITELPPLPPTMHYLDCSSNDITNLTLPPSLVYLDCSGNSLTTLPSLPSNLTYLSCGWNNLTSLPTLPSSLRILNCSSSSSLSQLPALPPSLRELDVSYCSFTTLSGFPDSLESLDCSENPIGSLGPLGNNLYELICSNDYFLEHLPALPPSLQHLEAEHCALVDMPIIPEMTAWLWISDNSITSLPNLPAYDFDIDISHNPISCLPFIPPGIEYIYMDATNINCVPNIPPYFYNYLPLCEAGNINGCFAYPSIRGSVFGDFNNNGVFDSAAEFHANNIIVRSNPGNYIGISDSSGNFKIWAPLNSTDTVSVLPLPAYYLPPSNIYTITFDSTSGQESWNNDFGIVAISNGANLEATITTQNFRPGFDTKIFVTIRNVGTNDFDGTATLSFDPLLTFVSADEGGTQSGNTITWSFTGVHPFQTKTFVATINSPVNLVIGTELNNSASGSVTGATDVDESNNSQSIVKLVVSSYDPNDKEVSEAAITTDEITAGKYLEYTIHFQNTGTAPATFINVVDTLSDKLDPLTFEMISSSHQYEITLANDLTKANHPVYVKWLFNNIQLPDSSVDFAGSQGFVKFRIKPKSNLVIGDEIQNTAGIYFDFNAPVITNTAITDVVVANSISTANGDLFNAVAYPNPASNTCTIHLTHVKTSEVELEITDAIGSVVMQKIVPVRYGLNDLNLNLRKFERGVYFVTIRSFDQVQVLKLVKE